MVHVAGLCEISTPSLPPVLCFEPALKRCQVCLGLCHPKHEPLKLRGHSCPNILYSVLDSLQFSCAQKQGSFKLNALVGVFSIQGCFSKRIYPLPRVEPKTAFNAIAPLHELLSEVRPETRNGLYSLGNKIRSCFNAKIPERSLSVVPYVGYLGIREKNRRK